MSSCSNNNYNNRATTSGTSTGSVTEDSGKYIVTGNLDCSDRDRGENYLQATTKTGKYGTFCMDKNGTWSYTLNNNDSDLATLDKGERATESFVVYSKDGSASKSVIVTVNGADEKAQSCNTTSVGGTTSGSVTEDAVVKTSGGKLTINGQNSCNGFTAVTKAGTYGTFTMKADGTWAYTIDNSKAVTQALTSDDAKTETFDVYTRAVNNYCGPDIAAVKKTITVTVNGADEQPTSTPTSSISGDADGTVKEDTTAMTVDTGRLMINGRNSDSGFVAQTINGSHGTFSIAVNGTWTYTIDNTKSVVQALNEGQKFDIDFLVSTKAVAASRCDPGTAAVTSTVKIHVLGTDEAPQAAPVVSGSTSGDTTEDSVLSHTGKLSVSGDTGFQALTNVAGTFGKLSMTTAGQWTYTLDNASEAVQSLAQDEMVNEYFTVKTASGVTQLLTMQVTGTNDAPVAVNDNFGQLGIDQGYRAYIDVTANDTDIDHGAQLSVLSVDAVSAHGAILSIDADGNIYYEGSAVLVPSETTVVDTFHYTVTDEHHATSIATVTVNLVGTSSSLPE